MQKFQNGGNFSKKNVSSLFLKKIKFLLGWRPGHSKGCEEYMVKILRGSVQ